MITKINAKYVVGFKEGEHVLYKNGCIVYEDDTICYVGSTYNAHTDRIIEEPDGLISPGFIDLDALGDIDHALIYSDFPKDKRHHLMWTMDYFNMHRAETMSIEEEKFKSLYAYVQLIRNGITTAMPITSVIHKKSAETYAEIEAAAVHAKKLGLRVYLGPSYLFAKHVLDDNGRLSVQPLPTYEGETGLYAAERFINEYDDKHCDLIKPMLAPERIELQTEASLKKTKALAEKYGCLIRLHAAQSKFEHDYILSRTGLSPIEYLDSIDFLGHNTLIPHTVMASGNPALKDLSDIDQLLLKKHGSSIIHCPLVYARSGEVLHSFGRYKRLGVNIAMGTDTFPPDMIENIKIGAYFAKYLDAGKTENSNLEFFNAATLGGARALNRNDLGRLSPGAKADMIIIDLSKFEIGIIDDPLQTIFGSAHGNFVKTSIINGRLVMQDRQIAGIDYDALKIKAQSYFDKMKFAYKNRNQKISETSFFYSTLKNFD